MRGDSSTAGIATGVLAYFVFSLHDAAIKLLVADIPVWQVLFFRSGVILIGCLLAGRRALLERAVATNLKSALAFRGVVNLAAWLCYYSAARSLPLGQLLSLYFAAPLMITVMARQILKEQITRWRWISVAVGFVGVLFASDPTGVRASWPALLVLVAAALWGYGIILMRQIARIETTLMQMLSINAVFFLATGVMCVARWQPLTSLQVAALLGVGLIGGLAQFLVFEAARKIPASVMATVEYSALPWAFVLGWLIWRDIPAAPIWFGAALIIAAGALLVRAERQSYGSIGTTGRGKTPR
jgi:drug/metabolite transporter (DMT)-like permease